MFRQVIESLFAQLGLTFGRLTFNASAGKLTRFTINRSAKSDEEIARVLEEVTAGPSSRVNALP